MQSPRFREKETTTPEHGTPDVMINDPYGEDRRSRIAAAAYFKAVARGFEPGYELEDWLAAEAEQK